MPPLGARPETTSASQDTCCAWIPQFPPWLRREPQALPDLPDRAIRPGSGRRGRRPIHQHVDLSKQQQPTVDSPSTAQHSRPRQVRQLGRRELSRPSGWGNGMSTRPSRDTSEPPGPPGFRHPAIPTARVRPVPPSVHPIPHGIRPLATLRTGAMVLGTFMSGPGNHSDPSIYTIPVSLTTTTLPRHLQPTKSPVPKTPRSTVSVIDQPGLQ